MTGVLALHPGSTKGDAIRASFYYAIDLADEHPDEALELYALAIRLRASTQ